MSSLTIKGSLKVMSVLSGLLAIVASLILLSRSVTPEIDSNPPLKGTSKDWRALVVQIEQLWSDGKWYPRDPLPLEHGLSIQGNGVGQPDFEAKITPMYRVAGEPSSIYLARTITANCADGGVGVSTVLHDAATAEWQARIQCKDGVWRMSVVGAGLVALNRRP